MKTTSMMGLSPLHAAALSRIATTTEGPGETGIHYFSVADENLNRFHHAVQTLGLRPVCWDVIGCEYDHSR